MFYGILQKATQVLNLDFTKVYAAHMVAGGIASGIAPADTEGIRFCKVLVNRCHGLLRVHVVLILFSSSAVPSWESWEHSIISSSFAREYGLM